MNKIDEIKQRAKDYHYHRHEEDANDDIYYLLSVIERCKNAYEGILETESAIRIKSLANAALRAIGAFDETKQIHWVTCEVISTVGYHDTHEVGDVIQVDSKHVDEMIVKGFIRTIGCDYV